VIIGTFHGFIVPGEEGNFSVFDPNIKFHFEVYNDHVNLVPPNAALLSKAAYNSAFAAYLNKIKPNRTIDIAFNPRAVPADASDTKFNLAKPPPQSATVTLTGFSGLTNHGIFKTKLETNIDGTKNIEATPTLALAAGQVINTIQVDATHTIKFFAGDVDDPFFFDLVGFSNFIRSIHNGSPDTTQLNRVGIPLPVITSSPSP